MKPSHRWLMGGVGVLTLVFGLLCLNYTKMGSAEHHAQIAQQRGWPPPSRGIDRLPELISEWRKGKRFWLVDR